MGGSRRRTWLVIGAIVLVALVVVGVPVAVIGGAILSGTPISEGTAGTFPTVVAGLPVVSVAEAVDAVEGGQVDGQAIAVAGYYNSFQPSCPYPGRYIGPLERWCDFTAFTDAPGDAQLCQQVGSNETDCRHAGGTNLDPWFMPETSGSPQAWLPGGAAGPPAAFVLVGHTGDPRAWQCTDLTFEACARAFVVDRIAWAAGQEVPVTAPETGTVDSGKRITPHMTLHQVLAAAGVGDRLLTAAPFRAGDVASIDPRWTLPGDDLVWLVRSLAEGAPASGAGTIPETVLLVDDATGQVLDRQPLSIDPGFRPARLWPVATVHGQECCAGEELAFVRVTASDGKVVHEGLLSGGSGGDGFTTYGGGYGSAPIVLPAGDYTLDSWLASYDNGVMGARKGECSTKLTLASLDDVAPNADFPAGQACTFRAAAPPTTAP